MKSQKAFLGSQAICLSIFLAKMKITLSEKVKLQKWLDQNWPENVIRCKGMVWFANEPQLMQILEQAGSLIEVNPMGIWAAADDEFNRNELTPEEQETWDETYGDRMIKLVFIGRNLDQKRIIHELDECLACR